MNIVEIVDGSRLTQNTKPCEISVRSPCSRKPWLEISVRDTTVTVTTTNGDKLMFNKPESER